MAATNEAKDHFMRAPEKVRTSLEITGYMTGVIFVMGVIFNAGIEVNQMSHVRATQESHDASIRVLQSQLMPINEQLARQDALLSDIRDELRRANENRSQH
jgi:hypothetical protein